MATRDPDGNFATLTKWIDGWCPEGTGGSEPTSSTTSPANGVKSAASDNPVFVEENGLVAMGDLLLSTARLVGRPLALRLDDGSLQRTIDRLGVAVPQRGR